MRRLPIFLRHPNIVDVLDVRNVVQRPRFRSPRLLALLIAIAVAIAAAASWWTYAVYLKPSRDQRRVDEAVMLIDANPSTAEWIRKLADKSDERRLISLSLLFRSKELGIDHTLGLAASRSALDLAIHHGSREARLSLGAALRDGKFGGKDPQAAISQFSIALEELQPLIKAGDQDALYVYSLMLRDGLGVEPDTKKARDILKRVALTRDADTMRGIGSHAVLGKGDQRDLELAKAISQRLIEIGHAESYWLGSMACDREFDTAQGEYEQIIELARAGEQAALRPLLAKQTALKKQRDRCRLQFVRPAAEKGDENAISALAELTPDSPQSAVPGPSLPASKLQPLDPEVQSQTGYLNGTKQVAKGGLSTFKIDNTKGGGDAVVRLYRDGKKPAARSMFVRNGESFMAEALAPSTYKLRYRYIGSENTFEADETFTLTESLPKAGYGFLGFQ